MGPIAKKENTYIFKKDFPLIQTNIGIYQKTNKRRNPADTDVFKTSSRRLTTKQDVVTTSAKRRRIYDILKTSDLGRLEDVQFTTS